LFRPLDLGPTSYGPLVNQSSTMATITLRIIQLFTLFTLLSPLGSDTGALPLSFTVTHYMCGSDGSSPSILSQSVSWPLQHLMTSSLVHFIDPNSTLCPPASTLFRFHSASSPITFSHTFSIDGYYEPPPFYHTYNM